MDAATRSKLLKIGGGMVSLGKSLSPEAVGLDLRSLDTGDGSKGDSGGGDTKGAEDTLKPKPSDGDAAKGGVPPKVFWEDPSIGKQEPLVAMANIGPQGLSNTTFKQFEWASGLPKETQEKLFPIA